MTFTLAASNSSALGYCAAAAPAPSGTSLLGGTAQVFFPSFVGSGKGSDQLRDITSFKRAKSTKQLLRAAKQQAKFETSKVATRIAKEWVDNLFWQLDELLDPEEWDDTEEAILSLPSWQSFLKGLFVLRPMIKPGLGLSANGNVVASWSNGSQHLDIEFKADDQVRWVLAAEIDGQTERTASRNSTFRLPETLAPYGPERWFGA